MPTIILILVGLGWNVFAPGKVWMPNIELQRAFTDSPALYQQMVAEGQPCMVQISSENLPFYGLGLVSATQPACPYDPSNTNLDLHAVMVREPFRPRGK